MKNETKELFVKYFSKIELNETTGQITNFDEVLSQDFMDQLLKNDTIDDIKSDMNELVNYSNEQREDFFINIEDSSQKEIVLTFLDTIIIQLLNKLGDVKNQQQQDAQKEHLNVEAEEKSEAEQKSNGNDVKVTGMSEPQSQTLEPANQNAPVMLKVAEQAKGATEKGSEQGNALEESQQSQNASADAGIPAKTGSEENPQQPSTITPNAGEPAEQQQSIKNRLDKINSDAKNLIRLRDTDEIEGFVLEEKFNSTTCNQLINTQQSYIDTLKDEVELLNCEKILLLEQKERLEKKVSGYVEMSESKNREIKANNAKMRKINTEYSAMLRFTQESVAEQICDDSEFRNLIMAKYSKVEYKAKTLTTDEQEAENRKQLDLYNSMYDMCKNRQRNRVSKVKALKTELLALVGATETVKKEESKTSVLQNDLD